MAGTGQEGPEEQSQDFVEAKTRLEEIVAEVRDRNTDLERSLELLEEGVRLANVCTESIDHTQWRQAAPDDPAPEEDTLSQ